MKYKPALISLFVIAAIFGLRIILLPPLPSINTGFWLYDKSSICLSFNNGTVFIADTIPFDDIIAKKRVQVDISDKDFYFSQIGITQNYNRPSLWDRLIGQSDWIYISGNGPLPSGKYRYWLDISHCE